MGTTESAICRYLKDERMPRIDILSNMATALGVSLDYLVTGKESKENMSFKILTRNIENLSIEKQKQIVTIIIKQLGGE